MSKSLFIFISDNPEISLVLGITFMFFAVSLWYILWTVKYYFKKNFNDHSDWKVYSIPKSIIKKYFFHFSWSLSYYEESMKEIMGSANLITDKKITYTDFFFYPSIIEEYISTKIIFLTDQYVILTRFSFLGTRMKYKVIPFNEIENLMFVTYFSYGPTIRLRLNNGGTYQFTLNKRLLSKKMIDNHNKIVDFLRNYDKPKR